MIPPYECYVNVYCGNLNYKEYQAAATKAEAYIRQVTMCECDMINLPDRVKRALDQCICELADTIHRQEVQREAASTGVASETNDGISVSYRTAPSAGESETEKHSIVYNLLGWTGLLYRGMGG